MLDPRSRRKRERNRNFKEIMAENFPNLKKETDILVQEAQRVANEMNSKMPTLRHIIIKMAKVKETVLKEARGKNNETL